nr:alpha/beta hydrolase [Thermoanaerobaculia bacterium]
PPGTVPSLLTTEKKADLKLYTTSIAMDDIDEVRAWLGYDKINLEGGSYGTRAAQVYMRRHPEHVRSAALFGVAGMTQYLPLYHAPAGKRSLDLVVAACLADTACQKAFPNLASELAEVVARLGREPANARISLEKGKPEVAIRIERGVFAEELRFMLYQPGLTPLVPLVIHQAYQGDWRPFVRLSLVWEPLLRGILAIGMHLSVTCAEDVPYFDRVNVQEILAGTYLGDYRSKQQIEACREWVRGEIPADFHQPVSVRVPTLLVSGNFDPVTPPQWAEEAARHLPLSLQVLVPEGGHSLGGLTNPECIENLEQKFFEQGSVDGLDTSCVKTMKRRPFATDPAAIDEVLAALGG